MSRSCGKMLVGLAFVFATGTVAYADKIKNPTAVFAGLDKITGRTIAFEVAIDETVQFGSLQLTPRVCYSRPSYDSPQTDTFVEVEEISQTNEYKRIFSGWMFASSPGLSAVEHPVYDLWLTDCKGGKDIIKVAPEKEEALPLPVNEAKKATPVKTPPRAQNANNPQQLAPRAQPSQSFFPTNQPPSGGTLRPPINILPGRDGAGTNN